MTDYISHLPADPRLHTRPMKEVVKHGSMQHLQELYRLRSLLGLVMHDVRLVHPYRTLYPGIHYIQRIH
jgi:hypothetical protein